MEKTMRIDRDALPVVRASLQMKRKALEFNLRQYQVRLIEFEQAHHMTSAQFAERFGAGELGDKAEWFDWEFVVNAFKETEQQLKLVNSVQL